MIRTMALRLPKRSLYKVETNPQAVGLFSSTAQTTFGRLHIVTEKQRCSSEVVLFLHGLGGSWRIWTPLLKVAYDLPFLKNKDVLLVDLPGFGQSENHQDHLRATDLCDALEQVASQLGYTKIHLVGHSMGGFLTLDMAARSKMVKSVRVLAGSYFNLLRVANNPRAYVWEVPSIVAFYGVQNTLSHHPRTTRVLNRMAKTMGSIFEVGGPGFAHASRNGINYDAHGTWGSIKVPVKAVFGAKDRLVTEQDRQELQRILPNAEVHVIPGAGHVMMLDHAEDVAKVLFS
jgi:pimeloyl-ACP methyl ester carboxylesterase